MKRHTQTILADPSRGDGRDAAGTPGNCWQACLAGLLDAELAEVPHAMRYVSWWEVSRRAVLGTTGGASDLGCWLPSGIVGPDNQGVLAIGSGQSPRGRFWHSVLIDLGSGSLAWDPHPSRLGLVTLEDVAALTEPYPLAAQPALPSSAVPPPAPTMARGLTHTYTWRAGD